MNDAMLSTSATDSDIFRRATGKQKPKLSSPTALAFNLEEWKSLLDDDRGLAARDVTIATTAVIVGTNISLLRQKIIDGLFDKLSEAQIISFAVADANRAFSILREKNLEVIRRAGADGGVFHGPGTSLRKLDLGRNTAPTTAEDMNTTVVDTVPHWFAQARKRSGAPDQLAYDFNLAGPRAQWAMSLEHGLTDVWQQVLWEPFVLSLEQDDWRVGPPDERSFALWRAWALRDQVNLVQRTMLSRHEEGLTGSPIPLVHQTATRIETLDGRLRPVLGDPTFAQTKGHLSAIELLDRSYLGPFLDQALSLDIPGLTPRLLTLVLGVLQDLAEFALPEGANVEYRSQADIDRLRCAFAAADLKSFIGRALQIGDELASACLTLLTSDPFGPLNPLFRDGLWHRPLISNQDGTELYMLLGSLLWGAPVRRVERWLKGAEQDADLSETPTGKAHEVTVRERMQSAIRSNPLLNELSSDVTWVPVKEGEDIDALVRIGKTILVVEVKCFLAPVEPVERHNYLHKLESACEQARRKAHWLSEDHSRIPAMLRGTALEVPRFVPLVVVNQSNGTSCRFGETVVVDEHFLTLYLSGGSYVSAASLDFQNPGRTGFSTRILYQTAEEGENAIPKLFESHPGLANFIDAMIWETRELPLHGGNKILMASSLLDPDRYIAGLPTVHAVE